MNSSDAENRTVVPVSALEHYSYCPRQCALIHVEQTFDENVFTVRGRLAHERVDTGQSTTIEGTLQLRSVPIWSDEYGLVGKADVVEIRQGQPVPVEHKVNVTSEHATVQLCAQVLCLEEMLNVDISTAFLYSHTTKRRTRVEIDGRLRTRTVGAIVKVRQIIAEQQLPDPVNDSRCVNCSLVSACLPTVVAEPARIRGYQGSLFRPVTAHHRTASAWFD